MKNENLDFLKSIEKLAGEVGLILPSTFGKNLKSVGLSHLIQY